MGHISNALLIEKAQAVINPKKVGEYLVGDVGAALVTDQGNIYVGVCIDLASGTLTPTATPSANLTRTNYAYDAVGNRLSKSTDGQQISYTYNTLDQLVSDNTGTTYSYDGRGNQKTVTSAGTTTTYAWDAADRLVGVTKTGATPLSASYGYDADGRRVQVTSGSTTNDLWDEASLFGDILQESASGGASVASYVLSSTEQLGQTRSGATNYYLHDGQGNVRALVSLIGSTWQVSDRYSYNAFGDVFASGTAGTTNNTYRFTGQQLDQTGLYFLRSRYYDPNGGRFLSTDTLNEIPLEPSTFNLYAYGLENPLRFVDPSGHLAVETSFSDYEDSTKNEKADEELGRATKSVFCRLVCAVLDAGGKLRLQFLLKLINDIERFAQSWANCWNSILQLLDLGTWRASDVFVIVGRLLKAGFTEVADPQLGDIAIFQQDFYDIEMIPQVVHMGVTVSPDALISNGVLTNDTVTIDNAVELTDEGYGFSGSYIRYFRCPE